MGAPVLLPFFDEPKITNRITPISISKAAEATQIMIFVVLLIFLFPSLYGEGYQVAQSLLALGSGGLTGVGLGNSVQKSLYLPEPQNDFILAIIGEELGFLGILFLILLYSVFIWRGISIAINAPDRFGMLLASGVVIMVALQVILNMAVVTASMPATGINLPFISYGGNGILIFLFSAGVLMNISRQKPYLEGRPI